MRLSVMNHTIISPATSQLIMKGVITTACSYALGHLIRCFSHGPFKEWGRSMNPAHFAAFVGLINGTHILCLSLLKACGVEAWHARRNAAAVSFPTAYLICTRAFHLTPIPVPYVGPIICCMSLIWLIGINTFDKQ